MLMIPTSVADVSCQAVSPWFNQLGLSVSAASIAVPHLCVGYGRSARCALEMNSGKPPRCDLQPPRTDPTACLFTTGSGTGRAEPPQPDATPSGARHTA